MLIKVSHAVDQNRGVINPGLTLNASEFGCPLSDFSPFDQSCSVEVPTYVFFYIMKKFKTMNAVVCFSASAVDDLQMKELQDQLEAETYFSVKMIMKVGFKCL